MYIRQNLIHYANKKEKAKHVQYDCVIGDEVLVINVGMYAKAKDKINERFPIVVVHSNNIIRIQ